MLSARPRIELRLSCLRGGAYLQVDTAELTPIASSFADRDEAIKHGIVVQGKRYEVCFCCWTRP